MLGGEKGGRLKESSDPPCPDGSEGEGTHRGLL